MSEKQPTPKRNWLGWRSLVALSLIVPILTVLINVTRGSISDVMKEFRPAFAGLSNYQMILNDRALSGLVMGIAFVGLMWLGAEIMAASFCLPNITVSSLVGFGILFLLTLALLPMFVRPVLSGSRAEFSEPSQNWQALPPLPEKAAEFMTAGPYDVYIRTETGKIYGWNLNVSSWRAAQEPITLSSTGERVAIGSTAGLPGNPISTVGIHFYPCEVCGAQADYALLPDGSVWRSERNFPNTLVGLVNLICGVPLAFLDLVVFVLPAYVGAGIVWLGQARLK